jgi:hypothetical protein
VIQSVTFSRSLRDFISVDSLIPFTNTGGV